MLTDRNGKVKPNAYSHVQSKGCSIQREDVADTNELLNFVRDFLGEKENRVWKGVAFAQCEEIRSIVADDSEKRAVCVYDTALQENPAHAELCQTSHIPEADQNEIRHELFTKFGGANITAPPQYRDGALWTAGPAGSE